MIPEPGCQKPIPYFAHAVRRKSYTSALRIERAREIGAGLDARLDEVVAVHRGGDLRARQARAHELEHDDLRERVLERDAVGVEVGVAPAPLERLRPTARRRAGDSRGSSPRASADVRTARGPGGDPLRKAGVHLLDELDWSGSSGGITGGHGAGLSLFWGRAST